MIIKLEPLAIALTIISVMASFHTTMMIDHGK